MRHASVPIWANPASYSRNWKDQIMKLAEDGHFDRTRNAQRSSLIKLAATAFDLHLVSLSKGVCPRDDDDGGSQPLAAALAALKTAATNRE
jgi:hypothetical protein